MRRFFMLGLRILAQFVVAGGFTRAIDEWVVSLDPAWQLTVLAMSQLTIATAHAYLDGYRSTKVIVASSLRIKERTEVGSQDSLQTPVCS